MADTFLTEALIPEKRRQSLSPPRVESEADKKKR